MTSEDRRGLDCNAFFILGANTRDGRNRIVELAEERSLVLDQQVVVQARADLINPRTRLACEVGWLPGVSPRKATDLLNLLSQDREALRSELGLPPLARVNVLAAYFAGIDKELEVVAIKGLILEIAKISEDIVVEDVLRDINEDRSISGFPLVQSRQQVEGEVEARKLYLRDSIKDSLNRLSVSDLVQVVTQTVSLATGQGEWHAPALIDQLVDSYEVETQGFLNQEAENVRKLVQAIRDTEHDDEATVSLLIDKLRMVVENWRSVAQPIQISAKARGTEHQLTRDVGYSIRGLAVDLFNERNMLAMSTRLTQMLGEFFSDHPELAEKFVEDRTALSDIQKKREDQTLLTPVFDLCQAAIDIAEENPSLAGSQASRILTAAPELLQSLQGARTSTTVNDGSDRIALSVCQCAVEIGNHLEDWQQCVELLREGSKYAVSDTVQARLRQNLEIASNNLRDFGDLTPIKAAPSLRTVNGIGVTLYGNTDLQSANGSFMSTYYFVIFGIPIFPITRYRVIRSGAGYRFLGEGKLRPLDKWHIVISIAAILILIIIMSNS